jgi:predicted dehydrogenase
MYYAPLFEKHDPLRFRVPAPEGQPRRYTWQAGGNWYYFYTHYADPKRMTVEQVDGFELVRLWDQDRSAAEMAAAVFYSKPKLCDSFEQVSDGVDLVFIADCNGEGQDHLALATPGLKKGVATFVDKPFAYTLADAYAMLALADRHKAPLMSMSMLQVSPAVARFRNRLPETGGATFGSIAGGGTGLEGLIHTIAIAQHVFGTDIETVRVLSGPNHTTAHLDYGDRPDRLKHGVAIHCDVGPAFHGAMYVSAHGPRAKIDSGDIGDWEHPHSAVEVLKRVRQMVLTGKATEAREQMIESIAIAEAFRQARQSAQPVRVANVIKANEPNRRQR